MCIIAVKPEKVQFSRKTCETMWKNNPDGAGFMYSTGTELVIVKGLMTFDAFWNAYQNAGPLRKMVLHFRIKTHGDVNPENTHPFWVTKGKFALVHNGVIRQLINQTSAKESDTAVFARMLSENYSNPNICMKNPFIRSTLESYIGHSKVVFMDKKGETIILNPELGKWRGNVWYSNESFKEQTFSAIASKSQASLDFSAQLEKIIEKNKTNGETYKPNKPITVSHHSNKKLIEPPEHFAPVSKQIPSQKNGPNTVYRDPDFFESEDHELAAAMQNWKN
jgi:hypothetical protein